MRESTLMINTNFIKIAIFRNQNQKWRNKNQISKNHWLSNRRIILKISPFRRKRWEEFGAQRTNTRRQTNLYRINQKARLVQENSQKIYRFIRARYRGFIQWKRRKRSFRRSIEFLTKFQKFRKNHFLVDCSSILSN